MFNSAVYCTESSYYCCIKLKLSLEKNTLVYNKSQASFLFSIAVFTATTSILEQTIPPCSLLD